MRCNPDICPHCQYIGDGDSLCEATGEIVLSDWEPTDDFMGPGCPYLKKAEKRKAWGYVATPKATTSTMSLSTSLFRTPLLVKAKAERRISLKETAGTVRGTSIISRSVSFSSRKKMLKPLPAKSPIMGSEFMEERHEWFSLFTDRLRDYSEGGVWSDGTEILCRTESAADAIADLLWQLYSVQGEDVTVVTGYYDPEEDKCNDEEDRYTGWWYVTIE